MGLQVHLVDGTYELFRYHYSPANKDPVRGATRGVVASCLMLLEQGATHVAVATDHVIESFRNDLWAGLQGRHRHRPRAAGAVPGRRGRAARGRASRCGRWSSRRPTTPWPPARSWRRRDDAVERVVICTPDKDLGQCVGGKVWQWDRRQDKWFDANGVRERLGVLPESIPDLLALVGDAADGFPGLPGWGAKSAAAVLDRWGHLEAIPSDPLELGRRRARRRQAQRHAARGLRAGAPVPPHRHGRDRRTGRRGGGLGVERPVRRLGGRPLRRWATIASSPR